MVREAYRYDPVGQSRIASDIHDRIRTARSLGVEYGLRVALHGLAQRPDLNGQAGTIRGVFEPKGRYLIKIGASTFMVRRSNFTPSYSTVVLSSCAEEDGVWRIHGAAMDGDAFAPVHCGSPVVAQVRAAFAAQAQCTNRTLQLVDLNGQLLHDGAEGDAQLMAQATRAKTA